MLFGGFSHILEKIQMDQKSPKISLATIFKKWLWLSYDHIGWLILLNFIYAVMSITVIGLGFAISMIFVSISKLFVDQSYSFSQLWKDVRQNWKWAFAYGSVLILILVVLAANIYFYKSIRRGSHVLEWLSTAIFWFALIYLMYSLWVLPTKIFFKESLKRSLKKAWILCFDNLKVSLTMLLFFIGFVFVGLYTGVVYFLFTLSLTTSFIWVAFYEVIQKYELENPLPGVENRSLKELIRPWVS